MKQVTIYYWPQFIHCGVCGQLMQQEEDLPAQGTQRWTILACKNFYYIRTYPPYDVRNNCPNYNLRIRIEATEKHLEVTE